MAIPQATAYETDVEVLRIRVNYLREQVERLQSIDLDLQMAIQQRDELLAAAQAVIDRWETPLWKNVPATAEYVYALRDVVAKVKP